MANRRGARTAPALPHTFTGRDAVEWESTARYLNDRLLNAKKDKLAMRLVGMDSVNGHGAYHLVFSFAPGVTRDVFFDAQTHLILREIVNTPTQVGATTRCEAGRRTPRRRFRQSSNLIMTTISRWTGFRSRAKSNCGATGAII